MTLEIFIWSVVASIVAAVFIGTTYKIVNKNKTYKNIKQKGDNNTAFMDSTININPEQKYKGDNKDA